MEEYNRCYTLEDLVIRCAQKGMGSEETASFLDVTVDCIDEVLKNLEKLLISKTLCRLHNRIIKEVTEEETARNGYICSSRLTFLLADVETRYKAESEALLQDKERFLQMLNEVREEYFGK